MMSKDLISVIMSSYNSEETIEKSILSILKQDYKNIEFLIVDDCSKDSSLSIMKRLREDDKRIKIIENKKNIGLTKSLNKLLKISNGKYIARQDSDDVSLPHRLTTQINFIKKTNSEIITSRAIIKDTGVKIPKYSYLLPNKMVMKYKNPFIHGTLVIKKSVIENIGGYDERFYYAQDYKLFHDLMKSGYKFKNLKKILYHSNTINNISSNKKDLQSYYAYCVKSNTVPDGRK